MKLENQYKKKDEELFKEVQKLKNGDDSSCQRVYELSEKYIYKIINDIVKNHHTTEDLMQEAYIQIYNKIDTLQEVKAFYVWAGRIATNLTLRYLQKNAKEVLATPDEEGETDFVFEKVSQDNEKFIPESVLVDREKQRLLAEIIDQLSAEQKICIQYFYYEEMSVNEIAQAFGCSTGTIKSRLNYARKSIKEAVVELDEKHGTRLYSLASAPLFLIIFRAAAEGLLPAAAAGMAGGAAAAGGAASTGGVASAGGVVSTGSASSVGSAASTGGAASVSTAGSVAGTAAGSTTAASAATAGTTSVSAAITTKIAVVVGAAMIVGGGGSTAVNAMQIVSTPQQMEAEAVVEEVEEVQTQETVEIPEPVEVIDLGNNIIVTMPEVGFAPEYVSNAEPESYEEVPVYEEENFEEAIDQTPSYIVYTYADGSTAILDYYSVMENSYLPYTYGGGNPVSGIIYNDADQAIGQANLDGATGWIGEATFEDGYISVEGGFTW